MKKSRLLLTGMGCFLCFGTLSMLNVLFLPYARSLYRYSMLPTLLAMLLFLCGYRLLSRRIALADEALLKKQLHVVQPCLIALLFVLQLALGYLMEYTPAGDNFALYSGSIMWADEGSLNSDPNYGLYFARFSNQWGFLQLLFLLRRLFTLLHIRSFFMLLVAVQALLYMPAVAACASAAQMLGGTRARARMLLLLFSLLPLYLAAGVLYTDTYSTPFVVLAFYFLLRVARAERLRSKLSFAFCAGACVFFGAQIKPTVFIVFIAAAIVWVLSMKPLHAIACILLSGVIVFSGTIASHRFMLHHLIDPSVYRQQHTPSIHWFMMSIPTSDHPYGNGSGDYGPTWQLMDDGASHEEIMSSIYTRIKDRIYTLRYPDRFVTAMLRKNSAIMGDGTFGMTEMLDDSPVRPNVLSQIVLEPGAYYPIYTSICTGIFMADLMLALLGCLQAIRRKCTDAAIGYIALFGILLFLMLWEARSRYLFNYIPLLLILSSLYIPNAKGTPSSSLTLPI